jgi:hypothetical protein
MSVVLLSVLVTGCSLSAPGAGDVAIEQGQVGMARPETLPDQNYRYLKLRESVDECVHTVEYWVGEDESGLLRNGKRGRGCGPRPQMPGGNREQWFAPGTWYGKGLGGPLPSEPEALVSALADETYLEVGDPGWEHVVVNAGVEHLMHVTDLAIHDAFFEMVRGMKSVRTRGLDVDAAGRQAVRLVQEFSDDGDDIQRALLFDPHTGELLEVRERNESGHVERETYVERRTTRTLP